MDVEAVIQCLLHKADEVLVQLHNLNHISKDEHDIIHTMLHKQDVDVEHITEQSAGDASTSAAKAVLAVDVPVSSSNDSSGSFFTREAIDEVDVSAVTCTSVGSPNRSLSACAKSFVPRSLSSEKYPILETEKQLHTVPSVSGSDAGAVESTVARPDASTASDTSAIIDTCLLPLKENTGEPEQEHLEPQGKTTYHAKILRRPIAFVGASQQLPWEHHNSTPSPASPSNKDDNSCVYSFDSSMKDNKPDVRAFDLEAPMSGSCATAALGIDANKDAALDEPPQGLLPHQWSFEQASSFRRASTSLLSHKKIPSNNVADIEAPILRFKTIDIWPPDASGAVQVVVQKTQALKPVVTKRVEQEDDPHAWYHPDEKAVTSGAQMPLQSLNSNAKASRHTSHLDDGQAVGHGAVALNAMNKGRKMLEGMGWTEGKGLGSREQGLVQHITAIVKSSNAGLGAAPAASKTRRAAWAKPSTKAQMDADVDTKENNDEKTEHDAETSVDISQWRLPDTDPRVIDFEMKAAAQQKRAEEKRFRTSSTTVKPKKAKLPHYNNQALRVKYLEVGTGPGPISLKLYTKVAGGKAREIRHPTKTMVQAMDVSDPATVGDGISLQFDVGDKLELLDQRGKRTVAGNVRTKRKGFVHIYSIEMTRKQWAELLNRPYEPDAADWAKAASICGVSYMPSCAGSSTPVEGLDYSDPSEDVYTWEGAVAPGRLPGTKATEMHAGDWEVKPDWNVVVENEW